MSVDQTRLKNRLNRIAGQVAGLQMMVDENRYCVDVLTQVAAIRSALDSLGVELLTRHIGHCVAEFGGQKHPEARGRKREDLIEEMRVSLTRFIK